LCFHSRLWLYSSLIPPMLRDVRASRTKPLATFLCRVKCCPLSRGLMLGGERYCIINDVLLRFSAEVSLAFSVLIGVGAAVKRDFLPIPLSILHWRADGGDVHVARATRTCIAGRRPLGTVIPVKTPPGTVHCPVKNSPMGFTPLDQIGHCSGEERTGCPPRG
jgi:hypothetical protein